MNYFIQTYGCQYNEWEAARINFMLQKIGFIETVQKEADIIFIIACSVRQTAVDRILGKLHNLSDKTIIITGCILDQDKISFEKRNAHLWDNRDPAALIEILQNLYSSSEVEKPSHSVIPTNSPVVIPTVSPLVIPGIILKKCVFLLVSTSVNLLTLLI